MQNKILIIGPAWVGDMVMAQTLFKLIKQQNSNVLIDVLAPEWSRPLLERMPEVHQSHALPIGHKKLQLLLRYRIGKQMRQYHYDQVIVLPNSFKSGLIPFFAKIQKRTGWLGEYRFGLLNDFRFLNKKALPLMIERFASLGIPAKNALPKKLPFPKLQIKESDIQTTLKKHQLNIHEKPILAICPGAEFGPAKRWPSEHYAHVVNQKMQEGWQVWIFGSKNDSIVATEIQKLTDNQCIDLTGKTSLAEAIDLMSLAKVVITNDSGLMHIAAALQKPIVVMYGSSSPKFTPPLADKVKILSLNLSCSPCFKRECPLQHFKCLKDLKPEMALQAISEL